jgi:hypothetical protein
VSRHLNRIPFTLFFRGMVGRDEPAEPGEEKKGDGGAVAT